MPEDVLALDSDTGIVGISLGLTGQFDPQALSDALPFKTVALRRKGAANPCTGGSQFFPADYLKLVLDDAEGLDRAIHDLVMAVSSLDDPTKCIWDSLDERSVNAGLSTRKGGMVSGHLFSELAIAQLASIRAELIVTVYCVPIADDPGDKQDLPVD